MLSHTDSISLTSLIRIRGDLANHECSPEMNGHDLIPHLFVHIDKSLVSEDTSVGDQDMDRPESVDTSLDDSVTIFSRANSSDSLTTDYTRSVM